MSKKEKITPQEAVEAIYGLISLIDKDQLAKLSKLDDIDGLKTRLEEVEAQIKAFGITLTQPVKIEDPVLIEDRQVTRNYCIQFSYLYSRNSSKILKRLEKDISDIKSDLKEIKVQLEVVRRPWWKRD